MPSSPSFSLGKVEEKGLDDLIPLYHACESFIRLATTAAIDRKLIRLDWDYSIHTGAVFQIIQVTAGEIAGVLDVIPSGFKGNPSIAFINLIMIHPKMRGLGLGKAVLQEVETTIWQNNEVHALQLAVQVNNPDGICFWQAQGYYPITGPALQPDGTTTCLYEKQRL